MTVRVSVITISYRDLPGLKRTLASVQGQRGEFVMEHIVIDGGSGADVERFLRSEDSRLAYWQSQPDDGRYSAMNEGIGHATGHMLWFLHSGDRFSDDGSVAAAARRVGYRDRVWLGFRAGSADWRGSSSGREWGFDRFDIRRFALGDRPIPHQAAFFGAGLVRRLGPYDTQFGLAADQLFMLRAALMKRPVLLPRVVCDFDTSGAGSTRSLHEHYCDSRRAIVAADYHPVFDRRLSLAASGALEAVARGKLAVRTVIGR